MKRKEHSPARPARLLKVLSTTRLSCCSTSGTLLSCELQNSMYASSNITSTGSLRSSSISSGSMIEPSGLLGEVRNKTLGLYSLTASWIPRTFILNPGASPRGISMTRPAKHDFQYIAELLSAHSTVDCAVKSIHAKSGRCIYDEITRLQNNAKKQIDQLHVDYIKTDQGSSMIRSYLISTASD